MKQLNGILLGCLTVLLLPACSKDRELPGLNPAGERVCIRLDAPEAMQSTRSVAGTNSAKGGLTNVDWSEYDLRYQLAIYSQDGTRLLVPPQTRTYDTYGPATFEFRLTPDNTYRFVAWADFVEQGSTEDLHYDTADFSHISVRDDAAGQVNDESRDAFFVTRDVAISQTFDETLTLKRPFAKVRVVTTDWDEDNGGVAKPDNFRISYHDCSRFSALNAVSGDAVGETQATQATVYDADLAEDENGGKFYAEGYDASETNRTLTVDYLIATPEQQAIHFNLEMREGANTLVSRDFATNIPIQRNHLTTLVGNLISTRGEVTVDIDENFDGENTVEVEEPRYIGYTAAREMDYTDRFQGDELEFIDEQCTYDAETGEGRWAYTGTVTAVGDGAFNGETDLRSITLPEGVVRVGSNAFNNSGLEAVALPGSLEEIDQFAFSKTQLTEILLPAGVKLLGSSAFDGVSTLARAVFEGAGIRTIESNTFQDCAGLREVRLPEGLETIRYNAFLRCAALEEITLPDAVTAIEKQVFSQCDALTKVTLGTRLESIGADAFNDCLALEVVVCPDETPAELGDGAFPVSDGWDYTAGYKIYVPDAQLETYRTAWSAYWDDTAFKQTKVIYPMSSMPAE